MQIITFISNPTTSSDDTHVSYPTDTDENMMTLSADLDSEEEYYQHIAYNNRHNSDAEEVVIEDEEEEEEEEEEEKEEESTPLFFDDPDDYYDGNSDDSSDDNTRSFVQSHALDAQYGGVTTRSRAKATQNALPSTSTAGLPDDHEASIEDHTIEPPGKRFKIEREIIKHYKRFQAKGKETTLTIQEPPVNTDPLQWFHDALSDIVTHITSTVIELHKQRVKNLLQNVLSIENLEPEVINCAFHGKTSSPDKRFSTFRFVSKFSAVTTLKECIVSSYALYIQVSVKRHIIITVNMCYPKMKEVIFKDESGILPVIEEREEDLMAFRTFWPHDPLFQILSRRLDEDTVVWLSLYTRLVRRPSTFLQLNENISRTILSFKDWFEKHWGIASSSSEIEMIEEEVSESLKDSDKSSLVLQKNVTVERSAPKVESTSSEKSKLVKKEITYEKSTPAMETKITDRYFPVTNVTTAIAIPTSTTTTLLTTSILTMTSIVKRTQQSVVPVNKLNFTQPIKRKKLQNEQGAQK
ncbi:hypothetical protein KQX54_008193 [Cotesia glomerata]|uniref:Uncharacterized protein n=1 Tax=Cotesia glomerata TaxID=32391 RepID=A0AAV7IC72_COTGL|nr:hypothetical protein KQX54_008193 [Cotesia glomerata]